MYELVKEIDKRLNCLNFNELWNGFSRYELPYMTVKMFTLGKRSFL
ncbi:MAG: hypothetical protein GXX10_07565 [Clostridiaceae bacterium]|nr:hypothetical protein [Clostridiaceae bacterium]